MGGFDGSININTKIDSSGFNNGVKGMSAGLDGIGGSLKKLAAIIATVFSIRAIVNFGKESVQASTELSNALLGLQSILQGQGRNFKSAQAFIQSYISDGLIPATNAITAYKNLASRGYTDPQIQNTLQALKDSAAFGRQASYSLGDAVSTATEGLKNENSILVDNAGVTKNVAKMWEDYAKSIGVSTNDLTKQQKIQAEYNGIMEETRFQVGDAAKLAGTYSGQVQQLGFNFNNLKVAVGNALIPIASAVLPGLNAIITALTRVANLFAQVTTALFGRQAAQQQNVANTAGSIAAKSNDAAKAQNKLANATKKAGKAADNSVASFDELNVLQQDKGNAAADTSTPDISAGAVGDIAGQELGAGVTVSPAVQAAADTIRGIFDNINKALEPTKAALAGLWTEFQRLGGFAWQGLLDFYNSFLVPVGKWTLGVGLPGFINALKDGMSKIDWGKINTSLHGLWVALAPFAINVGEGLLWFWKNVLVPLGTWTMNNVVPLFIDILANSIKVINGVIEALKPLALWLFDNFLKPIAEWTGGVIVSVLTSIKDALGGISDWINQNQGVVQGATITVGAFFAAWKTTELLAFVQQSGGIIATIASLTSSIVAGTAAKLADKAETIALTAMYAKDFVVSLAQGTAALIKNAAQWVISTAAKIADTVAQAAATVATIAWNAACTIATAVTTAFGAAMAFLTSPIGLVVLAIAAVIAIVVLLVTHWDQVKAAGAAAWEWIKNTWSVASAWFNSNVVQPVGQFFTNLWNGIKGAASIAWQGVSGVWIVVATWFNDTVVTPIANFFGGLWEGIKSGGSVLADFMRQYVIDPIVNLFKGMYNSVVNIMEGMINGFVGIINSFIRGINSAISTINKIPGVHLGTINTMGTVKIPRLATGAVIPPRAEFAAILGDQRSGTNIEAPEGLIRSIVSDELGKINFSPKINVVASGNNTGLVRWMKFEIEQDNRRIGPAMATGGGR